MAGTPSTARVRLHADWHQLQQPTSHSVLTLCGTISTQPRDDVGDE